MKALFVSQYADPNLASGNNNVFRQARALTRDLSVTVEVLTWPQGDRWSGPLPPDAGQMAFSRLEWVYQGVKYHVLRLPMYLLERVLSEEQWRQAVQIGRELLQVIRPDVVHLQHWRGLWWMLDSARQLGIPTVYSSHDWGVGCLRTVLVKGEGGLCDGTVEAGKCRRCIWRGRGFVGKANEVLVATRAGEKVLGLVDRVLGESWLSKREAVRIGLTRRIEMNTRRARDATSNLSALIVPSTFARKFFMQFGLDRHRVHVEPWYSDLSVPVARSAGTAPVVFGYIGRISPDKGVRRIFDALLAARGSPPCHLVIAGATDGEYARQLMKEFHDRVGVHTVEWMGFVPQPEAHRFYEQVDVVLITSEWMDNTPLSLIEALACKRPVIISDLPTVTDLVQDGQTGYLVTMGSTPSLTEAIVRVSSRPEVLDHMRVNMPQIKSTFEYADAVKRIYQSVLESNVPA